MSYRAYGVLIIVPYLALIIMFHGHLQTYDSIHQSRAPSVNKQKHYYYLKQRDKVVAQNAHSGVVKHHLVSQLDLSDSINDQQGVLFNALVSGKNVQNGSEFSSRELLKGVDNRIKGLHVNAIINTGQGRKEVPLQHNKHKRLDRIQKGHKYREDAVTADIHPNNEQSDPHARKGFQDLHLKSGLSYPSLPSNRRGLYEWLGVERVKDYQLHPSDTVGSVKSMTRLVTENNKKATAGQLRHQQQQHNDTIRVKTLKHDRGPFVERFVDLNVKATGFNPVGNTHAKGGGNNKKATKIIKKVESIKPASLQGKKPINASFINTVPRNTGEFSQQSEWHSNFPLQSHCVKSQRSRQKPLQQQSQQQQKYQLPSLWDFSDHLQFQSLEGDYIFSAYLDEREVGQLKVRVIALLKIGFTKQLYCHFINPINTDAGGDFLQHFYKTSRVQYYEMCENHAKEYGGYILTCDIPPAVIKRNPSPCAVTLSVMSKLDAPTNLPDSDTKNLTATLPIFTTNTQPYQPHYFSKQASVFHHTNVSLHVHSSKDYNVHRKYHKNINVPPKSKQDFGLCVPPIFNYIPSTTLIEFIELSRILGANHITFYRVHVSTEINRVLDFYRHKGYITVIPWQLPLGERNIWYHGQLLAINDCLYRSMHRFKYVSFNDLDEFVVPVKHSNWSEMVRAFDEQGDPSLYSGYSFRSAFFDPLSGNTRVLYDLESDLRTKGFSSVRTKVMVMPEKIYELGIHHISRAIRGSLQTFYVGEDLAYVHHYRQCMNDYDPKMKCQLYAKDETLYKYIPLLRHNVHRTMWLLKENNTIGAGRGDKFGGTRFFVQNIL